MFPHGEFVYKQGSNNFRQLYEEHGRILDLLDDLTATCRHMSHQHPCANCSREQQALCAGRLPSFFHDLFDLCSIHFYREECLIEAELTGSPAHTALKQHRHAHGTLLRRIGMLISESRALLEQHKADAAYRHLYLQLSDLIYEHDKQFDAELVQSINRELLKGTL